MAGGDWWRDRWGRPFKRIALVLNFQSDVRRLNDWIKFGCIRKLSVMKSKETDFALVMELVYILV